MVRVHDNVSGSVATKKPPNFCSGAKTIIKIKLEWICWDKVGQPNEKIHTHLYVVSTGPQDPKLSHTITAITYISFKNY